MPPSLASGGPESSDTFEAADRGFLGGNTSRDKSPNTIRQAHQAEFAAWWATLIPDGAFILLRYTWGDDQDEEVVTGYFEPNEVERAFDWCCTHTVDAMARDGGSYEDIGVLEAFSLVPDGDDVTKPLTFKNPPHHICAPEFIPHFPNGYQLRARDQKIAEQLFTLMARDYPEDFAKEVARMPDDMAARLGIVRDEMSAEEIESLQLIPSPEEAEAICSHWYDRIVNAPDGDQNNRIVAGAFHLGTLVAYGLLDEGDARKFLLEASLEGNHPRGRAVGAINSGMKKGLVS